jgi:hypothetical protein
MKKSQYPKIFNLAMQQSLYSQIKTLADIQETSIAEIIRTALEQYIQKSKEV